MIQRCLAYLFRNVFYYQNFRVFRHLKRFDVTDHDITHVHQIEKLQEVTNLALTEIPYYRDLAQGIEGKVMSYSDFQKIPILTKEIIRSRTQDLVNLNYSKRNQIVKNTSGGSTGAPVEFYQTKEQKQSGTGNYYYALFCNGVDVYNKSADLWGAERDMHRTSRNFSLGSFLQNKIILNTYILSDDIIDSYIKMLNVFKPKFIKAYVHSLYDISKYINSKNLKMYFTPIIHCTTGPLYPEMRKEISKAFNNAHVYNFYGSREVSAIGTEVRGREGMFVLFDNVFVEILDEYDAPVKKGEEGEVVVTTLNNHYMPLLRYKIGDRAIKGDSLDFGTLIIDKVLGRTLGVIHKQDGSKVDGQFFTSLFFNKKGITSFQLIQRDINSIDLYVVKNEDFSPIELKGVTDRILEELGEVKLKISYVNKIDLSSTGKIMYVYSDIN